MNLGEEFIDMSEDYRRIEQVIRFIEQHFKEQPSLDAIAGSLPLSKFHFHRLFKRWAGVTPLQFLHFLTVEYCKKRLRDMQSVFDASLAAGLSGGSRLHDLFVTFEAVTPGEYKRFGKGLQIRYGFHPTPFGEGFLATTDKGICALRFVPRREREESLQQLKVKWPEAEFAENPTATRPLIEKIFAGHNRESAFHLAVKGTNFQVQVWRALLAIPPGSLASYQDIASLLGRPAATRAVAGAIAANPVAYLIPCHRVIRKSGKINEYRWGAARKKALIGWEAARMKEKDG